jgi:GAF domain-containing protein
MLAGPDLVGALTLYARTEGTFHDEDVTVGQRIAAQAAYTVVNAMAYERARALGENLSVAMQSRAVIEQAKGIIIASTGCEPEEAFDRLREQSHENVKVRALAESFVRQAQVHRSPPAGS